jgi:hypothetical protein
MKLDPGIHIVMHSVLFLKPGVTETFCLHYYLFWQPNFCNMWSMMLVTMDWKQDWLGKIVDQLRRGNCPYIYRQGSPRSWFIESTNQGSLA